MQYCTRTVLLLLSSAVLKYVIRKSKLVQKTAIGDMAATDIKDATKAWPMAAAE